MASGMATDDAGSSSRANVPSDDSTVPSVGAGATTQQQQQGQHHAAPSHARLSRKQSGASSTSRRSSTTHRSPSLSAQSEPYMPQRFSSSQQEKQDMLNAMEFEEEALVNNLSRKLEKVSLRS